MDGVTELVQSGPLLLAMPVAAAAGAVTFLSPCILPLVPGYLSYITGMSGAGARRAGPDAGRTAAMAGAAVGGTAAASASLAGPRAADGAADGAASDPASAPRPVAPPR